jgi:esterase/lipase superfamily enzyme
MKPEYQKFILNLRVEHMGGAVSSGKLLYVAANGRVMDWDQNVEYFTNTTRTGRQRLLVLLHGYNNTYEQGLEALTKYMNLMEAGNSDYVLLAVLWPGDGWAKALSFPTEARDADDSADALYRWLDTNVDKNASISFIAHSLGCRVAMRAAGLLARKSTGPRLGRICLLAAAINNDCLGSTYLTPSYRTATLAAERVAVLASEKDSVLRGAYPLGTIEWTVLRHESWSLALGYTGPKEHDADVLAKIELLKADPSQNIDHSDYLGLASEKDGKPTHTKSWSEIFALQFFKPVDKPEWPSTRPNPAAAPEIEPVRP